MWFLARVWMLSGTMRALFLIPIIVCYIGALLFSGKSKNSAKVSLNHIILGFTCVAVGSILLSQIPPSDSIILPIFAVSIVGFGFGVAHTTLTAIMISNLPKKDRGSALGVALTINYAAIVAAPLMMAGASRLWGEFSPFILCGVLSILTIPLAIFFGKKLNKKIDQPLK